MQAGFRRRCRVWSSGVCIWRREAVTAVATLSGLRPHVLGAFGARFGELVTAVAALARPLAHVLGAVRAHLKPGSCYRRLPSCFHACPPLRLGRGETAHGGRDFDPRRACFRASLRILLESFLVSQVRGSSDLSLKPRKLFVPFRGVLPTHIVAHLSTASEHFLGTALDIRRVVGGPLELPESSALVLVRQMPFGLIEPIVVSHLPHLSARQAGLGTARRRGTCPEPPSAGR